MNSKEIVTWVAFGMVAGACSVALAWPQTLTPAPTIKIEPTREAAQLPAQPVAPPPRCTHEVCVDRPRFVDCSHAYAYFCGKYEIQYEHHCDCDTWAP